MSLGRASSLPTFRTYAFSIWATWITCSWKWAFRLPARCRVQVTSWPAVIPAGRYVTFMFLGPNEDMEPVYQEMEAWLAQRGLVSSGQCIEQYYNGAPFPREQALTGVLVLLV
ncbi:MAG: GyrI-like domain-containing protein [Gordonibacter pamelaeae]